MTARDLLRRQLIVAAARQCFLQLGYARTSLDDIARRAGISRPLLYRKFENKQAILAAVYEDLFAERYPRAEDALAERGSRAARLGRVCELLLVAPWEELQGAPEFAELRDAFAQRLPELIARHQRQCLKLTQAILGDAEHAQLFLLAVDGLKSDRPTPRVLRRRVELLVDTFV